MCLDCILPVLGPAHLGLDPPMLMPGVHLCSLLDVCGKFVKDAELNITSEYWLEHHMYNW